MIRLPRISSKKLVKALEKLGFVILRQKGSHIVLQKKVVGTTRTTIVPNHKEIALGTLRSILRQSGVSLEELVQHL